MMHSRDSHRRRRGAHPESGARRPHGSPDLRVPPAPPRVLGALAALAALTALAALGALAGAGPATAATATRGGASTSPTIVKAVETDFHIALSKTSFSPGRYTFVAQNKGGVTHSLEITGPGLSGAKASNISPGHSTKLTVTFKKGAYDIFCPIPGHKAMGMNVDIVVGGSSTGGNGGKGGSSGGAGTSTTSNGGGGYGY